MSAIFHTNRAALRAACFLGNLSPVQTLSGLPPRPSFPASSDDAIHLALSMNLNDSPAFSCTTDASIAHSFQRRFLRLAASVAPLNLPR